MPKVDENDLHELWGNDCGYNEGTTYLFSKWVNLCQGDGFLSMGAQTGAIKLAMAGTQDWWCQFPPLLDY